MSARHWTFLPGSVAAALVVIFVTQTQGAPRFDQDLLVVTARPYTAFTEDSERIAGPIEELPPQF